MKLREKLNRRTGDKEYKRWYVTLTKEDVEKLEWVKNQELITNIKGDKLVLKPAT